jgi:hypothetical protein
MNHPLLERPRCGFDIFSKSRLEIAHKAVDRLSELRVRTLELAAGCSCHRIVTINRAKMPKLTSLTSLDFFRMFVFYKLERSLEIVESFDESGLQAHPPLIFCARNSVSLSTRVAVPAIHRNSKLFALFQIHKMNGPVRGANFTPAHWPALPSSNTQTLGFRL